MAKEVDRQEVIRALVKIALSRPNAAVELAYMDKPARRTICQLDLSAVSEFKRGDRGVEIKFIDRVKALDTLYSLLGGETDDGQISEFLRALEEAGEEREDACGS